MKFKLFANQDKINYWNLKYKYFSNQIQLHNQMGATFNLYRPLVSRELVVDIYFQLQKFSSEAKINVVAYLNIKAEFWKYYKI